jgi:uncharacterized membrane protein (UPF0127 family)
MRLIVIGVACAALLGACGSDEPEAAPGPSTSPSGSSVAFDAAQALIDTQDDSVLVNIEIADSEAARQQGLMGRTSLEDNAGMAFIFFEETTAGFWMKNTLIPLSIAFFDKNGKIVKILDMDPCEKDPCPVYDPGVPYFGALEVNQGAFDEWGVSPGDRITIAR